MKVCGDLNIETLKSTMKTGNGKHFDKIEVTGYLIFSKVATRVTYQSSTCIHYIFKKKFEKYELSAMFFGSLSFATSMPSQRSRKKRTCKLQKQSLFELPYEN